MNQQDLLEQLRQERDLAIKEAEFAQKQRRLIWELFLDNDHHLQEAIKERDRQLQEARNQRDCAKQQSIDNPVGQKRIKETLELEVRATNCFLVTGLIASTTLLIGLVFYVAYLSSSVSW